MRIFNIAGFKVSPSNKRLIGFLCQFYQLRLVNYLFNYLLRLHDTVIFRFIYGYAENYTFDGRDTQREK